MLQDGYKYPQNSIPLPFYLLITVFYLNLQFINFKSKCFPKVKFIVASHSLGSCDRKSCCVFINNFVRCVVGKSNHLKTFVYTHERQECKMKIKGQKMLMRIKNRVENRNEVKKRLLREGIESNPGPTIESFKVITINCNGLTSDQRLLQAIGRIKKRIKTCQSIIFLQETHNANLILLENIWKGNVNISNGTGGSRGVITLSTEGFEVLAFQSDEDGRYLFTTFKFNNNKMCHTANIYSPNNHNVARGFFANALEKWDEYCNNLVDPNSIASYVVAGDLNCVISGKDSQNRNRTKAERDLAEDITTYMDDRGLFDSVLRSPNGNNFTWNRVNIFSKIDYIYLDQELLGNIKGYYTVWDLVKSDHAAICIDLNILGVNQNRGRSYPKLSHLDLKNKEDCDNIRSAINDAIREFPKHWNPHQKLDYVKVVLRTITLEIRSMNKMPRSIIDLLRLELEEFNKLIFLDEDQTKKFNELRVNLYREEEKQAERLRIMAGVKWREEGERSTKYFLNAVKTREAMSTLDYLQTDNSQITDTNSILKFSKEFYKNLYSERKTNSELDYFQYCPKISDSASIDLDKDITIEDLKITLKTCKDSTPGLDGIPYCFYKVFANELLPLVLDAWKF